MCLWTDNFCRHSATVKELLKSDSICESYAQMKNGPVVLIHHVCAFMPLNARAACILSAIAEFFVDDKKN